VVDDHDMGITHVIRGDDHLTNAFRQIQIYRALGWPAPVFAHIPLIHGADGAKLSKRHGALGVDAYREAGFLPEAMRNYLLRLGWSHGDEEIIDTEHAIAWFDLDALGRSAARFDMARLTSLNAHYLRQTNDAELVRLIAPRLEASGHVIDAAARARLEAGMAGLKPRATTLLDLAQGARFYVASRPVPLDDKAAALLDAEARTLLGSLASSLQGLAVWDQSALESCVRAHAEALGTKLGQLAQPLRAALTGSSTSPGIFEVMAVLGRDEALARIEDAVAARNAALQHSD
jgi:glutamyl-tRNA synthetase